MQQSKNKDKIFKNQNLASAFPITEKKGGRSVKHEDKNNNNL